MLSRVPSLALAVALAAPAGAQCAADRLFAAGGAADDRFGHAVALDPTFPGAGCALVGAALRDVGAMGQAGSAFVFERVGAAWVETAELVASDARADAWLGSAVALWGDTALVGARGDEAPAMDSGSVYVFERGAGGWAEAAELTASDPMQASYFGSAVALELDTALIGAPHRNLPGVAVGAVYVFERAAGVWSQVARVVPSDPHPYGFFGAAIALSGTTALVGSTEGALSKVYVLERVGGAWGETGTLAAADADPDDGFGYAVALDGDRALVGAPYDDDQGTDAGAAYVFERGPSGWTRVAKLTSGPGTAWANFGRSVALRGDRAVVAEDSRAWVIELGEGGWAPAQLLLPDSGGLLSEYGECLALAQSTLLVGQPRGPGAEDMAGAVHAYRFADGIQGYCTSTVNSSGGAAHASAVGCGSHGANDLEVEAVPLPVNTTGFFIYGPERAEVPFASGFLCVAGQLTRLSPTTTQGQTLRQTVDVTRPPTPWGTITPGSTWYFQAWFRDPVWGGSNLSDGLAITFGP